MGLQSRRWSRGGLWTADCDRLQSKFPYSRHQICFLYFTCSQQLLALDTQRRGAAQGAWRTGIHPHNHFIRPHPALPVYHMAAASRSSSEHGSTDAVAGGQRRKGSVGSSGSGTRGKRQ